MASGKKKTDTVVKDTEAAKSAAQEKKKAEPKKAAPKKTAPKKAAPKKKSEKKSGEKFNLKFLGGLLFAKMMRGGAKELRANADEVNKLNVFPVPDGDTGDNMSMTIESGIAALENTESDDLAEVLQVLSRGMLLGARGNSGVILSQFFAGIAKGFAKSKSADPKALGEALRQGVEQAYLSVMTPTEGTILTVAREAVEFAVARITPKSTIKTLFADLSNEMHASLERTPDLLPALKEAGVVDSGGAGLFYIIDGLNRVLNGEEVPEIADIPIETGKAPSVLNTSFGADSEMVYGYCTEFLLQLQTKKTDIASFNIEPEKEFLSEIGDSVVCFKTDSIVKVHVHTFTPEKVLAHFRELGEFLTIKIENMSVQHTEGEMEPENNGNAPVATPAEVAPAAVKPATRKRNAVVEVSCGPGIEALFRELGADEIVRGGQTKNPSTSDFIEVFDRINAENIYVFPNNGNIVMAAQQAAEIYEAAKVYVMPSKTIGGGYVALSNLDLENMSPDEIVATAEESIAAITTAYLSPAVRDADMNGIHINDGDFIGVCGKDIIVSHPDKYEASEILVDKLLEDESRFMITLIHGVDAPKKDIDKLEKHIKEKHPGKEVYLIDGGQDIYPYLIVVE